MPDHAEHGAMPQWNAIPRFFCKIRDRRQGREHYHSNVEIFAMEMAERFECEGKS
jgi:hypothetical protein